MLQGSYFVFIFYSQKIDLDFILLKILIVMKII